LNRVVTNILHEITVLGLLSFALFLLAKIVYTFAPQYHDVLSVLTRISLLVRVARLSHVLMMMLMLLACYS